MAVDTVTLRQKRSMNYMTIQHVSRSYGERVLFKNVSLGINQGQKIGFVAKNGMGKTSLLHIIAGLVEPDQGLVQQRKDIKISYVPQEPNLDPNLSIEESILASDNEKLKTIARYEKALENPDDADAYQKAFDAMDRQDAWTFETTYKQILFKLKLEDLSAKVGKLSGGQKKRLALAITLLTNPDLLILDEPTNHLDLEMIEWLESYFKEQDYTLLMVTHDRYFLDRVCNEIIELEDGKLYTYKGNYSYYLDKKEERMQVEAVTQEKAQQLYKKELEWMRRQPKARTTKSKSRIDDFADIKSAAMNRRKDHKVQLEINMERLGTKVIELHNISKSFGDKKLLKNFTYNFQRGERIGIIGKNGTGKSTLLNIITRKLQPDTGKVIVGDTVKLGYYTQGGIELNPGEKVIDVIKKYGEYIPLAKGRIISASQLLERFLFDNKKKHDYVEKLSGGERKRLYLCTVLIQNPNFLILDEPTNDLDIPTLNVLENFLMDFPGCVLVVSHDRYFMDKIVDHIFVLGNEGKVTDFPGNYTDYRAYEDSKPPAGAETKVAKPKNDWKEKNVKAGLTFNEQKELKKLDKRIPTLERKIKEVEASFMTVELSQDEITERSKELSALRDELEESEMRWLELSDKAE